LENAAEDFVAARFAALAATRTVSRGVDAPTAEMVARATEAALLNSAREGSDGEFVAFAQQVPPPPPRCFDKLQAVDLLFSAASAPDESAERILRALVAAASEGGTPSALARAFAVAGHVALRLLIYVDERISQRTKGAAEAKGSEGNVEEVGVSALAAAEFEAEELRAASERELSSLASLLGALVPPMRTAALSSRDDALRICAGTALVKVMCLSPKLCEDNLQCVFSLLASKSVPPPLRSNVVVGLADVATRFPNAFEPWTSLFVRTLRDEDADIRRTAIVVVTHLTLNDMIKVGGGV
jgi:condensin complex subunit 1